VCSEAHLWWYWSDDVVIPSPQFMHFLWFSSPKTFFLGGGGHTPEPKSHFSAGEFAGLHSGSLRPV